MSQSPRPLFREHALKEYMQRREKDILPRSVAPPTILFAWILLVLTLTMTFLAWWTQVPIDVSGNGLLLYPSTLQTNGSHQGMILAFLPVNSISQVHTGLPAQIQLGSSTQQIRYPITHVSAGIQSPQAIRQHYALESSTASSITQPAVVAEISLPPGNTYTNYADSTIRIQVQIGEQRVLSLLPGIHQLIGA